MPNNYVNSMIEISENTTQTIITDVSKCSLVTHLTTDEEINSITQNIVDTIKNHLYSHRLQKIQKHAEYINRLSIDRTVSNFPSRNSFNQDTQSFPHDVRSNEDKIKDTPLLSFIQLLLKLKLAGQSHLNDAYHFGTSPTYTYSVDNKSWSSPFLTSGSDALSLLQDLIQHTQIIEMFNKNNFLHHSTMSEENFISYLTQYV